MWSGVHTAQSQQPWDSQKTWVSEWEGLLETNQSSSPAAVLIRRLRVTQCIKVETKSPDPQNLTCSMNLRRRADILRGSPALLVTDVHASHPTPKTSSIDSKPDSSQASYTGLLNCTP